MPQPLQRAKPLTEQIHDLLAADISAGKYADGALLPTVTELAAQHGVSRVTANRALAWLETDGVAAASPRGYIAKPGRTVTGPQQWLAMARFPVSGRVGVLAAAMVDAPQYVRPLLGLEPVRADGLTPVLRREQVHFDAAGIPFMLSVEWYPPRFAETVPELLGAEPLAGPGAAARLIEERSGSPVVRGRQAREARPVRDDQREGPYLRLPDGAPVLAEVWMWSARDQALVYGEYVLIAGRVTENEWAA